MKTVRTALMLTLLCLVGCTSPTASPSPTLEPTTAPTVQPTVAPSATPKPTAAPTATPTTEPSPTAVPSATPTEEPSPIPQQPIIPEMVRVEPGTFLMGSEEGLRYEKPVHEVTLTRAYYVAIYPVTFDEYDRFCAATGRTLVSDNGWGRGQRPITNINWYDAIDYCNWLSLRDGLEPVYSGQGKNTVWDVEANGYRLLTEAEWEYAARGGDQAQDTLYAGSNDPDEVGWYVDNAESMTHPVGLKAPNELGIYDLSGNMWELCWDWYDKEYYQNSPAVNPTGPETGSDRSRRGGHYLENEGTLRISYRSADMPTYSANGFRIGRNE